MAKTWCVKICINPECQRATVLEEGSNPFICDVCYSSAIPIDAEDQTNTLREIIDEHNQNTIAMDRTGSSDPDDR